VRDGVVLFDGKVSSLKRFKDDVREVVEGFECGISLEGFNDIKEKDILECYEVEEIKQKL
jgi:translation initiation factor IF-2